MDKVLTIIDERGNVHKCGKSCGKGGQGETFRIDNNPAYLLKIVKMKQEMFERRYADMLMMNLPDDSNLALPITKLSRMSDGQQIGGYVMRFMEGMISVSDLLKQRGMTLADYWINVNDPRRTFVLLANLAGNLQILEERGAVYCDISPNNVYVSSSKSDTEVWLIDCDNIHYEGQLVNGKELCIGTPTYWAPEVQEKKPNTIKSDSFSFAVLAYRMLTMSMPFDGAAVKKNQVSVGWENCDPESDENDTSSVNFYDYPWCGSKTDDSNKQTTGIHLINIVTPELFELFRMTFEEGKSSPMLRPSFAEWRQAFYDAANCCLSVVEAKDNKKLMVSMLKGLSDEYIVSLPKEARYRRSFIMLKISEICYHKEGDERTPIAEKNWMIIRDFFNYRLKITKDMLTDSMDDRKHELVSIRMSNNTFFFEKEYVSRNSGIERIKVVRDKSEIMSIIVGKVKEALIEIRTNEKEMGKKESVYRVYKISVEKIEEAKQ